MGRWYVRDWVLVVAIVVAGIVTWLVQPPPSDASLFAAWRYPVAVVGFLVVIFLLQTGRTMAPFRLRPVKVPDWAKAGRLVRAAVMRAQREAIRMDHNYVGTEHLLLGLLADPASPAGALLAQAGVNLDESRERIEKVVGRGEAPVKAPLGLTPRSARAIEFAFGRVRRGGEGLVDDRHLLEGVLAIEDGLGAWLVTEAGCSVVDLRRAARDRS
ncbi:MAG TPA: Clp protease N-terminal domain-containing protein [Candidatus Limnocylindrales bacterium]|nr:Clp protease N-terminal domain-containing protein [Candidatus Limnocylindrales bacterium]